MDARNHIFKDNATISAYANPKLCFVLNAPFLGIQSMEMDMASRHNNPLLQFYFACRPFNLNAWCAFDIARFPNWRVDSERKCVRARHFQLRSRARRA